MRILIDGRHLTEAQPSGVGEYTVHILRALFQLDQTNTYVILVTGRTPMAPERLGALPPNVSIRHVAVPNKILTLALALTGRPYLDRLAGGGFDLAFLPNIAVAHLSPGLPYVLTLHDLTWKLSPELYSPIRRLKHALTRSTGLANEAKRVVTHSEHARRDAIRLLGLAPGRVLAIPHGIGSEFSPKMAASDFGVRSRQRLPKRFALFVGTREPRKNIDAILDGLASYREKTGDDLPLVIVGPRGWNDHTLERRLRTPETKKFVRVLGYVPSADRPAIYRAASVLIWPSLYEGFGLPVLEAMASGTPVITSHASAMPELTGKAALLVNPYDAGEIAAALGELMTSPKLQASLSTQGIVRAKAFSWAVAAEHLKQALEGIAKT